MAASAAADGAGFSARALDAQGAPAPEAYFKLNLSAGGVVTRDVLLTSGSDAPLEVIGYPVDALTGVTSGVVFANRKDPVEEAGRWVGLSARRVTLAPGASRRVRVTIRVPADAAPGDHVGGVVFQRAGAPKASGGTFSVRQVVRVALATHVRVDGSLRRGMALGELGIKPVTGTQVPSITMALRNTGNVLCKPIVRVELVREGQALGVERRDLDTILPGDEIAYPMPWPRPLDAGTYDAGVSVMGCGPEVEQTATLTLADALTGTQQAPGPRTTPQQAGGIPVWAMGVVAMVGILGGFLLARRRPRRERREPEPQAQSLT